ncbi:MAG: group II intron reverse transcriptase/maturase [candidate division Zixibacteria bacterium]|nr:group II intron reverse transcriptase/maturase [candidate division Zixibacteria bacterium]
MATQDTDRSAGMPNTTSDGSGRNPREHGDGVLVAAMGWDHFRSETTSAAGGMNAVVERENMTEALRRVERNKGAAGIDQMPVRALRPFLKEHWSRIKEELLSGRYRPSPVRDVMIPKPGGQGVRTLGIPTVVDRLIQQALHQVLSPIFDPFFSDHSYGFRPGRSAHQAVRQARAYVSGGRRWVVDMDLEKFFDTVNHDIVMSRVGRRVGDRRVLAVIRRYVQAGTMMGGVASPRPEGTPQGGPLSPLLSNILLDDLDKELERRGHAFCRYADDCNIYVQSRRAGERVLASITRYLTTRLTLTVNRDKSTVDRPWRRTFLGYSMTFHRQPRLKVAPASVQRLKRKLRVLFRRGRGRNLGRFITEDLKPLLQGWISYFRLAEVTGLFEERDGWLRRKLRNLLWRQWKRTGTRARKLMHRGLDAVRAWCSATNGRGPWWNSGASHMNQAFPKSYFDRCGLVSLLDALRRLQRVS